MNISNNILSMMNCRANTPSVAEQIYDNQTKDLIRILDKYVKNITTFNQNVN